MNEQLVMSDPSTPSTSSGAKSNDRLKGKKTLKVEGFLEEFEKDEVKQKVNIVSVFTSFGVELAAKGKSHTGLCPFHDDHKPSLSVDGEKGLFHCFGCGASGDVIDAVKKFANMDFREALAYLKNYNNMNGSRSSVVPVRIASPQVEKKEIPEQKTAEKEPEVSAVSLKEVANLYHGSFLKNKLAGEYLAKRGLHDPELLERFSIGFADGSLPQMVGATQKKALQELGILNDKGREHFHNCITVPLFDEQNQITGFYGRKIDASNIVHLYLAGGHKGLFNQKAFAMYPDEIILTESVIDALSLLKLGFQNVVPCYGTNGFTDLHLKALKDSRTKRVVLAFDNDEAGKKGSDSLKDRLFSEGMTVKQISPPSTGSGIESSNRIKDWNDFLVAGCSRAESREGVKTSVDAIINSAVPFVQEKALENELKVQRKGNRYQFSIADKQYRLIGVKQGFVSSLRVNLRFEQDPSTSSGQGKKHIDNVDLYSARSRASFAGSIGTSFGISPGRVEHDLIRILEWLEYERDKLFTDDAKDIPELTEEEKRLGFEFLMSPDLMAEISRDTEVLGYVGEPVNKMLMYLAASSRKLADPISVIVLSQSAAGKSYLIDTIKKLIPPEDVVSMTSLSDQALNYLPADGLLHKFLVMGEAVHGDVVEHQIREMLSAHELSRLVTMKDPKTGELSSKTVRKDVTVSAVMSSTNHDINQENASRCFVVNTDESIEQTRNIHESQRKKYSLDRYREKETAIPEIMKKHHAAQRLLTKRIIINPFAEHLRFPDTLMRSRRDHERFIDLISCVCFLRQFQKEEKQSADGLTFIECDLEDYRIAFTIMTSILPSTLTSFPKSAIELYETARMLLKKKAEREGLQITEVNISQREIREETEYTQMFVKRNMRILSEYEYIITASGRDQRSRKSYRLIADEPITLIDLSMIPTPEEMAKKAYV